MLPNSSSLQQTSDPSDWWRQVKSLFSTRLPLVLTIAGLTLMATGVLTYYVKVVYKETGEAAILPGPQSPLANENSPSMLKVDISGAVERPGVYLIPNDSRIDDVLITAGGLSPKASRIYLSKNINLAQRVFDGMKIYFPFEEEVDDPVSDVTNPSIALVNINTASSSQLDILPGIGPVTANKIIAARPYQNITELLSRHVVNAATYEKIKDRISTQ